MKATIYTRQSLARDGDELGVERQEAECRKLADSRGYEVVNVIYDNNVSASRGKRPGYARLLEDIESGDIGVVIVLRLDRLLRRLTELEELITLSERTGVTIITVQGDLDISNAQGRLIGRILASVARNEVETKSERHKLANRQRASMGLPHGSRRPYGYEANGLTIREEEAELLRAMAQRLIDGHSYKDIAHWMNQQGHKTTMGKLWYPVTVRNLLRKPRYGGWREYHGEMFEAQWEAVFTPEQHERLHLTIEARTTRSKSKGIKARKYLLTGLLVCGKCGLGLTGTKGRDRADTPMRRIYMCRGKRDTGLIRGCGGVRRNADALDHYIRESVIHRLDTPALAELLHDDDDGELQELLEARQAQELRISSLVEDYATGLLNRQQLQKAKGAAEASLHELDQKIGEIQKGIGVSIPAGQSVRDAWERCGSDNWRRQLVGLVVKQITVNPGSSKPYYWADGVRMRFDPSLIDIEWASG